MSFLAPFDARGPWARSLGSPSALEYLRVAFLAHVLQALRAPSFWRGHPGAPFKPACALP
jgi:hypothetical protein